jgi:hypothetical protein
MPSACNRVLNVNVYITTAELSLVEWAEETCLIQKSCPLYLKNKTIGPKLDRSRIDIKRIWLIAYCILCNPNQAHYPHVQGQRHQPQNLYSITSSITTEHMFHFPHTLAKHRSRNQPAGRTMLAFSDVFRLQIWACELQYLYQKKRLI